MAVEYNRRYLGNLRYTDRPTDTFIYSNKKSHRPLVEELFEKSASFESKLKDSLKSQSTKVIIPTNQWSVRSIPSSEASCHLCDMHVSSWSECKRSASPCGSCDSYPSSPSTPSGSTASSESSASHQFVRRPATGLIPPTKSYLMYLSNPSTPNGSMSPWKLDKVYPDHSNASRNSSIPCELSFKAYRSIVGTFDKRPKLHQCDECGKSFRLASTLSNHSLIHKNDKQWQCSECKSRFLRKSDLIKHNLIHTGIQPFECNVCGRRFSQSSNMITHKKRHTGIKPHRCRDCGKRFYRNVDLKRHVQTHDRWRKQVVLHDIPKAGQ